ncbi:hypothetical protein Nepgr_022958 [Nepenthes gracilis]|uniref:Uncharacterized protein n=1 Tax=Nepenthes gracilis TaxID=150966 RepID=A0AAD3T1W7_NEPGR|nr:hypothetical protein Nepgr_022958 [Nepenthes gracilis]
MPTSSTESLTIPVEHSSSCTKKSYAPRLQPHRPGSTKYHCNCQAAHLPRLPRKIAPSKPGINMEPDHHPIDARHSNQNISSSRAMPLQLQHIHQLRQTSTKN